MKAYEVVRSSERLPHIAQEVLEASVVALDLETTGFSPYTSKIRLLSLNTGKGIYVVDMFETGTIGPLEDALAETNAVILGQNLKFDVRFLLHFHGLELRRIFDTYRASALIYNGKISGKGAHDLYALYARELEIAPEAPDLGGSDWTGPLTRDQLDYAAEDVIHLPTLRLKLIEKIKKFGLAKIALIEFQAILPEAAMELAGFGFDKEAWTRLAEENGRQAARLQKELLWELPHPGRQIALPGFDPDFNLNSSQQLLKSLQMLGLPITSTNEMTLAMYAKDYPLVSKILSWRGYAQAVKTFGVEFLKHINPITGRIHTQYYPFTGAGRYASSAPNLQQIPRDAKFRSCFSVAEGRRIICADYSQIELRIIAELSGDKRLTGVYVRGDDAHAETASLVTKIPKNEITKHHRQVAKSVNFGLCFAMAAPKLVLYARANYGVEMSLEEAETFRRNYFEAYEGIRSWHNHIFSERNRSTGQTRTIAGRLRYLEPTAYSEYANSPVQGSAADGLKTALALTYQRLKKYDGRVRMVHMVHDEILLEADNDPELLEAARKDLERAMIDGIQPMLKTVPVEVEGGIGTSWADK